MKNVLTEIINIIPSSAGKMSRHNVSGLLKEWEDPRHNQLARESISMVEPFLLKMKTKNIGSNPKRVERDNDIRAEYDVLLKKYHDNQKLVREELSKKYPPLKPSSIKAIKYSIKDLM